MTSGFWRVANISNQAGYQWTATTHLSLEQSQIYVIFSRPLVKAYKIMRSWKYFQDTEIGHLETFPLLIKKLKETNQAKVPVPFPTEFLNLARNSIIYNLFWSNQGQVFLFLFLYTSVNEVQTSSLMHINHGHAPETSTLKSCYNLKNKTSNYWVWFQAGAGPTYI